MPIDSIAAGSSIAATDVERAQFNPDPLAQKPAESCPYCGFGESARYYRGRTATIVQCRRCGGLYDPDRTGEIALDAAAERVTHEYLDGYRDNASTEPAIARSVLDLLRERVPAATRYLEVGCGNAAIAAVAAAQH